MKLYSLYKDPKLNLFCFINNKSKTGVWFVDLGLLDTLPKILLDTPISAKDQHLILLSSFDQIPTVKEVKETNPELFI